MPSFIDDMIDTARYSTLVLKPDRRLQAATEVYASCTHPILLGSCNPERIEASPIKKLDRN